MNRTQVLEVSFHNVNDLAFIQTFQKIFKFTAQSACHTYAKK